MQVELRPRFESDNNQRIVITSLEKKATVEGGLVRVVEGYNRRFLQRIGEASSTLPR